MGRSWVLLGPAARIGRISSPTRMAVPSVHLPGSINLSCLVRAEGRRERSREVRWESGRLSRNMLPVHARRDDLVNYREISRRHELVPMNVPGRKELLQRSQESYSESVGVEVITHGVVQLIGG